MRLIKPRCIADIAACVDMYYGLNDHAFLPVSKESSFSNLLKLSRQNEFVRMVIDDSDVLLGWMFANRAKSLHSDEIHFQQTYYASDVRGFKAYKVLKLLHSEMEIEAKRLGITFLISQGSHLDDDFTFTKMLEKCGWQRRGHIAVKRLSS